MGKGDGKKKRKKKSATPATPANVQPANPPPQRVSTDINISVKHQIRWGKIKKAAAKQAVGQSFRKKKVERTAFRRRWTEEEMEEKRLERKKKGTDPDWDVILNQTASRPLVIVDGYNVCFYWSRLKRLMKQGNLRRARELLVDDLESLSVLKGWRIEVVFDGAGKSNVGPLGHGPGGSSSVKGNGNTNIDVTNHGVRTVFTGSGIEADSYIEKRCFDAKNVTHGQLTRSFVVVSDDGMIRMAASNAGAISMSSGRLVDELKAVKKTIQFQAEAAMERVNNGPMRSGPFQNRPLVIAEREREKREAARNGTEDGVQNAIETAGKGSLSGVRTGGDIEINEIDQNIIDFGKRKQWNGILDQFEAQQKLFTQVNYGTALGQLGNIPETKTDDPRFIKLIENLSQEINKRGYKWLGVQSFSNIIQALVKMDMGKSSCARSLLEQLNEEECVDWLTENGSAQDIANCVWASAGFGMKSPLLFRFVETNSNWFVVNGNPEVLSMCIWSCGQLKAKSPSLIAELETNVEWFVRGATRKEISDVVFACGRLKVKSPALFEELKKNCPWLNYNFLSFLIQ